MRILFFFCMILFIVSCKSQPQNAPVKVVKVAVVIQDPFVDGKRIHETFITPGYTFNWNDPWQLNKDYEAALEEISHGVVDYQITEIIDSKDFFTYLRKSGERLNEARMIELLQEPGWATLKEEGQGFDYKAFIEHFGFDKKRDAGEIHEVWVWSPPMTGMWESNMSGKDPFWINSNPTEGVNSKEHLCVMGLNYERDLACALESYAHRFESTLMKVYGWWDYKKKETRDELSTWELYAAYAKIYDKYVPGMSHVGNVHFPPNGEKDYDWTNKTKVMSFADNWKNYPNVKEENPREMDCSEWGCVHLGYMKWWFSHMPHFKGINPKDGKLNNWWHYVVDYNEAVRMADSRTDANQKTGNETLTPVPFQEVKLTDSFWLPRLKTQKQTLVPFALDKTQPAVDNLRKTANFLKGIPDELPFPHRYVASDLYKVMEGAACLLTIERDTALERRMDQIIDFIADAQQTDGYLYESHITGVSKNASQWGGAGMGDKPYSWVVHSHELYNMGHMYEGAAAYYQATGKDKWLRVAEKNARHINRVFFEGDPNYNEGKPVNQAPGHEEIELALVKLYRITGNALYLDMAKRFIDIRGITYRPEGQGVMAPEYAQQHLPVREQTKAVGHSVRAAYLYSGMADVSALTGDITLRPALDSIWNNLVNTRMHITGGLGAIHGIEGFGPEYLLPNKDAYLETCAAVGNVFFNHRMYLMEKNGKYADVAEIALFNNVLAGVNLEGNKFFYVNPLEADGQTLFNHGRRGRSPWFGTACCPSNLARLIPQVSGMMYAYTSDEIYCSFYAGSEVCIPLKKGKVKMIQQTGYPFDENINITIDSLAANQEFTLRMRVPAWTDSQFVPGKLYHYIDKNHENWEVSLNNKKVQAVVKNGFISIRKKWKTGDKVTLHLPMPLHYTHAIDEVEADRERVCLTRGPLVYCAEAADNNFPVQQAYIETLPEKYTVETAQNGLMKGINFVSIAVKAVSEGSAPENVTMTLLPYYAWDNRSDSTMIVWIPQKELGIKN